MYASRGARAYFRAWGGRGRGRPRAARRAPRLESRAVDRGIEYVCGEIWWWLSWRVAPEYFGPFGTICRAFRCGAGRFGCKKGLYSPGGCPAVEVRVAVLLPTDHVTRKPRTTWHTLLEAAPEAAVPGAGREAFTRLSLGLYSAFTRPWWP